MGYHTKRREERYRLGLCRDCKTPLKDRVGYTMCKLCTDKSSTRNKKRRKVHKLNGVCIICGKNRASENRITCDSCKQNGYRNRYKRFFMYRATHFNCSYGTEISARSLGSLWKKQKGFCGLSRQKLTVYNAELDHVVPKTRGGSHGIDNLRWLTKDINRLKRNYLDSEFIGLCKQVAAYSEEKDGTNDLF